MSPLIANMTRKPVIIDCDPGADDSLGIMLALNNPQLSVLGITTVFGNGTVDQTAQNAAKICGYIHAADIQIYPGAEKPLKKKITFSDLYCGADGLCNTALPECNQLISKSSAGSFLAEILQNAKQPVTIISTGSMTNLAVLLTAHPELAGKIAEIVTASGYFGLNQKEVRAEWNILLDPDAAELVYQSGVPIRAIGLDVTCMLEEAYVENLYAGKTNAVADFMKKCTAYNRKMGLSIASLLVDSMATAAVLNPELARYRIGTVTVDPDKEDAGIMKFCQQEGAAVKAAEFFDFKGFLELLGRMTK